MNPERSQLMEISRLSPFSRRGKAPRFRDESVNQSYLGNETSMISFNDTSLRHLSASLIANPSIAGEGLPEVFFEIIQNTKYTDVLETLSNIVQACCDSLELVEPWNRHLEHNRWLAEEANTWRLLYSLYADSLVEREIESLDVIPTHPILSQQTLVSKLFATDSELRLLQLIVDWLENAAAYQDSATPAVGVINNRVHWGNTLHNLIIGDSLFNKEKNKSMVTCMDPDAPRRQKKVIHTDDQQDDNNLCMRIFKEVRCGRFDEATSLCVNAGQTWRSVVLQGWRLLHYKPRNDQNSKLEIVGNPSRDLWKLCCLGIINDITENINYRATIGVLSGHLPSVISVCEDRWDDLLWAHLRVQIEARIDKFLREHHATVAANTTTPDILEMLQKEYHPNELSLQQIFGCVNALMNNRKESNHQTCQRYLMLGHIASIMQESLEWLHYVDEKFLRFLAHLVLILRQMGKDPQHEIGDQILESYVTQLIESKQGKAIECPEMIAFYTSTVPIAKQPKIFSTFMSYIEKSDDREKVVKAATNAGLDFGLACRITIKQSILEAPQGYTNFDMTFSQTTNIEKEKTFVSRVINTLEWLSFDKKLADDALWLSNAMIRTFIFIGDTNSAQKTISKVNQLFSNIVSNVPSESSALREHLCIKAYLEAIDGFASWHRHFISGQPKDLEPLPSDATFTDKVHYEQKLANVKQLKERWGAANHHQSLHTKKLLYNVLQFPGGWLQDQIDTSRNSHFTNEDYEEREKQLETLKKLCIPEIVILILRILQSSKSVEAHAEAVKLADLIAAENRSLYKVFPKDKLCEILSMMKDSSLFLLENGRDSFGYVETD